jgi:hypothetical protein
MTIPGFYLNYASGAGPITVTPGQSVYITAFASIDNPQRLSGTLYYSIGHGIHGVLGSLIPVGVEQQQDFSGDMKTFQIGLSAIIKDLPPDDYNIGLIVRLPSGPAVLMLTATGGVATVFAT